MVTGFASKFYDNDIVRDLVSLRILQVLRSLSWNSLTMANSDYGCCYYFCCSTILSVFLLAFLSAVEKGDKETVSSYIRHTEKWKIAKGEVRRVVLNQKVKTSILSRRI